MSIRQGNNIISGNSQGFNWVGTKAEYEAAVASGLILNSWICCITDDTATLTTANIADSTDRRYCTDTEKYRLNNLNFSQLAPGGDTGIYLSASAYTSTANVWTKLTGLTAAADTLGEWDYTTQRFNASALKEVDFSITLVTSDTTSSYNVGLRVYRGGSVYRTLPIQKASGAFFNFNGYTSSYLEFYYYISSAVSITPVITINRKYGTV